MRWFEGQFDRKSNAKIVKEKRRKKNKGKLREEKKKWTEIIKKYMRAFDDKRLVIGRGREKKHKTSYCVVCIKEDTDINVLILAINVFYRPLHHDPLGNTF